MTDNEKAEIEKLAIDLFETDNRVRFGYVVHDWSPRINQPYYRKRAEILSRNGWRMANE